MRLPQSPSADGFFADLCYLPCVMMLCIKIEDFISQGKCCCVYDCSYFSLFWVQGAATRST